MICGFFFNIQSVGFFSNTPSLFYEFNTKGEAKDLYKLRASPFYSKTTHIVVFGDVINYQHKIITLSSPFKTMDVMFSIEKPIQYPIFHETNIFPIVDISSFTKEHTNYLTQLTEIANVSYIVRIKKEYYTHKKVLDFLKNVCYNIKMLDKSKIYLVPDMELVYKDKNREQILRELYKVAFDLNCKISIPYNKENLL